MNAEIWFEKHQLLVAVGLVVLTLVCTIFGQNISEYVKALPDGFARAHRASKENTLRRLEEFERSPRTALNGVLKNLGMLFVLLGSLALSSGVRFNHRAMQHLGAGEAMSFFLFEISGIESMLECLGMSIIAFGINLMIVSWTYRDPERRIALLREELGLPKSNDALK